MKFSEFFKESSIARIIGLLIIILGITAIIVVTFLAGEAFGYHRASFAEREGDAYENIFGGPHGMPMSDMFGTSHGAYGTIVHIDLPNMIVSDDDGTEKTIIIEPTTTVREFRGEVASTSLVSGEMVTVLGTPSDDGQVIANLIRVIATSTAR